MRNNTVIEKEKKKNSMHMNTKNIAILIKLERNYCRDYRYVYV